MSSFLASDTYLNAIVYGLIILSVIACAYEAARWWWSR